MGEAAQVQTDSSEHSAVLTTNQLINLTARGREVVSMLRTIPGVRGMECFIYLRLGKQTYTWGAH